MQLTYFMSCNIQGNSATTNLKTRANKFFSLLMASFLLLTNIITLFSANIKNYAGGYGLMITNQLNPKSADLYTAVFSYFNYEDNDIEVSKSNSYLSPFRLFINGKLPYIFEKGYKENVFSLDVKCGEKYSWVVKRGDVYLESVAQAPECNKDENKRVSSCDNPVGWVEDVDRRQDDYVKYYWSPKDSVVAGFDSPEQTPEKYDYRECSYAERKIGKCRTKSR